MNKDNCNGTIRISIIMILLLFLIQFFPTLSGASDVSGSESDIIYVEDNFSDDSKIGYKKNVTMDIDNNMVQLSVKRSIFLKTYGGEDDDETFCVRQTSDGGYVVAGHTRSYGDNLVDDWGRPYMDAWLFKTDEYGEVEWNAAYGMEYDDYAYGLDLTADGGYILAGATDRHGTYDKDIWLLKTDSTGYEEWNKTLIDGWAQSVRSTSDGGYLVIGTTGEYSVWGTDGVVIKTDSYGEEEWRSVIKDTTWGTDGVETSNGDFTAIGYGEDVSIINFDSSGDIQWSRLMGGSDTDNAFYIEQTSDGGYIIPGKTKSYGEGEYDVWLIKLDDDGDEEWNRTFGGTDWDWGTEAQQTTDGGYIISSFTKSYGEGQFDGWIIKTDKFGNKEWDTLIGDWSSEDCYSIRQTSDGGYITTGDTATMGKYSYDVFLVKTDSQGNYGQNNPSLEGSYISTNMVQGKYKPLINKLKCEIYQPSGSNVYIQFSQDNLTWYNIFEEEGEWHKLYNGGNDFDFLALNWRGSSFYYKIRFESQSEGMPGVTYVNLSVTLDPDPDNDNLDNSVDDDDDNDGYLDTWEDFLGSDPLNVKDTPLDTDNDIAPDGDSNNTQPWMDMDDDNDGLEDAWEIKYELDPLNNKDADLDYDDDGFSNTEEHDANTDPLDRNSKPKVSNKSKDIDLVGILIIIIIIISVIIAVVSVFIYKKKKSASTSKNDHTQQQTERTFGTQAQNIYQSQTYPGTPTSYYSPQVPPQEPTPTYIPPGPTTPQSTYSSQPPQSYPQVQQPTYTYQQAPAPTYYRCERCSASITDYNRCQYCGWERQYY